MLVHIQIFMVESKLRNNSLENTEVFVAVAILISSLMIAIVVVNDRLNSEKMSFDLFKLEMVK